jgi:hemolysin activation/secretion protein
MPPFLRHVLVGLICSCLAVNAAVAAGEPRFVIERFDIQGSTLFDAAEPKAALAPFTGSDRQFADIESARRAIRALYAERGFTSVNVVVPEQEISQGLVKLQVTEPRLGQVRIIGANHHDNPNVRQSLPALIEGQMPRTVALAESLRLANENPSKQTQAVLRPGTEAGLIDALVRVEDTDPRKVFVSLDNTGNQETGEVRLGIGWQNANLFNRDHVLTLHYMTSLTQPDDVSIFGMGYHLPLPNLHDSLDFHAGYSNVDSGQVNNDYQVSGKGALAGMRYNLNFTKRSPLEHRLVMGLDYRAYSNTVDFLGTPLGTEVTVHPVSLTYFGRWQEKQHRGQIKLGATCNVPGGDKGRDADFNAARSGAEADYCLYRYGASVLASLPKEWQLNVAFEGQYTHTPLVSGEQFGLGGMNSVRGFGERAVSGDRGWRAGVELSTPDLAPRFGLENLRLRVSGFLEGGELRRLQPQPGEESFIDIGSAGFGVMLTRPQRFNMRLDYGHVLNGGGNKDVGDGRLHASLSWMF